MNFDHGLYCPKCRSRLYPGDADYMRDHGVCSYCVTYAKRKPAPKPEDGAKNGPLAGSPDLPLVLE